mmetsp:Transcript_16711/g.36627  ORF Transcript_16711/g.36627 Transcript_16711/m.36627 type:complete len:216 (+) Transcript_16711:261-908(+)
MNLKDLQRLVNELPEVHSFPLPIVHLVSGILGAALEQVENRKHLPVVRDQGLPNELTGEHKFLEDLQRGSNHLHVARVQSCLDGNDQLRNHWQDLRAALVQHVVRSLHRQEAVRIILFPQAIEKDGQVMMIVQFLDVHLPQDPVCGARVLDLNGEVVAVIELPELRALDPSSGKSPRLGRLHDDLWLPRSSRYGPATSTGTASPEGCRWLRRISG